MEHPGPVRLDFLIAADFAQADSLGKISMIGGGVEVVGLAGFPAIHPSLSLACRLVWEALDPDDVEVTVSLIGPTGSMNAPDFQSRIRRQSNASRETATLVVTYSGLPIPIAGKYRFRVSAMGQILGHYDFEAVLKPSPESTEGSLK